MKKNKITKREALIDVMSFMRNCGDISEAFFSKKFDELRLMSKDEIDALFARVKSINLSNMKPVEEFSKNNKVTITGKTHFNDEDKIIKEFDSVGDLKSDHNIVATYPVPKEKKKEPSYRQKLQKIAAKLNSTKDPDLLELARVSPSLWQWDAKLVDTVFNNLDNI